MKPVKAKRFVTSLLLCIFISCAALLYAVTTLIKTQDNFNDFAKGELKGTSLNSDGKISLGPKIESRLDTKANQVWSIAVQPDGAAFIATGNEGKIFKLGKDGKSELFCDLEELEVYALALDKQGVLFAGASPGGKIYKIPAKDKPELFFETKEDYIWDLVFDDSGNLYAATGAKGKIFSIDPTGKGDVLYDSKANNVLSLVFGPDKKLYAASQGKGFVFRIEKKDKAYVLYQASADEVKQITFDADGNLYAALNSSRSPAGASFLDFTQALPAVLRSDEEEQPKSPLETPKPEKPALMPVEKPGKSSVIKIDPKGYIQTIWAASEAPIHSIFFDRTQRKLLATAGEKGKIFAVSGFEEYSIIGSVDEKYVLCMAGSQAQILLGTGNGGKVYSLDFARAKEGTFTASVLDMNTPVHWGNIEVDTALPEGAGIAFRTRAGNTSEPDATWSDWSAEESPQAKFVPVKSPDARFIQWEARLKAARADSLPVLDVVKVTYVQQNLAPIITKLDVAKAPTGKEPAAPKLSTIEKLLGGAKEGGDKETPSKPSDSAGKPEDSNPKKVRISWHVNDPNNDEIRSIIYFKGEDETTWKKIKDKLTETNYVFDTFSVPDGRYRIKAEVTDAPSNPTDTAKTVERISDIFYVDNTPPEISELHAEQKPENKFLIRASATDLGSIIGSAKYNIDAQDWIPLLPSDGLFDSKSEQFSFETEKLEGKEHTISLVVTDGEGNTAAKKVILKLK